MRATILIILNCIQPLAVVIFLVAGILSLMIGQHHKGAMNLGIAFANFIIFYGGNFLK